ncbi:hypothetical protein [Polyangium sp. 15x6]|uniref:hypothetical protein n=1 Tax=Polyangium sp. 15x6 TaxID=3042687 RepID=UPI00249BD76B|nr:hypothetical protein [Polyangium sp. 15x6]MDI3291602.1 hypothetical protein [Polyangium sp. 15x6]
MPESMPVGLILDVERTVIPDGSPYREHGQLTDASSQCDPNVPDCVRVSTDILRATYQRVRRDAARGFRARNVQVSPHYGFRTLTIRWPGGQCSFVDGVTDPLEEADQARFSDLFWFVASMITHRKEDAGADASSAADPLPRTAIAVCNDELKRAMGPYNLGKSVSDAVALTTHESKGFGHHGEPPSVYFVVGREKPPIMDTPPNEPLLVVSWHWRAPGAGPCFTLKTFRGETIGTHCEDPTLREWTTSEDSLFRSEGQASAILWGGPASKEQFFSTFKRPADVCLKALAEETQHQGLH